jgi:hypothetical protein
MYRDGVYNPSYVREGDIDPYQMNREQSVAEDGLTSADPVGASGAAGVAFDPYPARHRSKETSTSPQLREDPHGYGIGQSNVCIQS